MSENQLRNISEFQALSSFFLMIIQSCFLTLFQGQGWIASVLLIIVNMQNFQFIERAIFNTKLKYVFLIFWVFSAIKLLPFQWILYMTVVFLATIFFILNYINTSRSFLLDIYKFLSFVFYYSIAHVVVLLLFKQFIEPANLISGIRPYTFYYLFFYNYSSIDNVFRIQGIAWEPGIWQLFLNLFLYLSIIFNRKVKILLVTSICIYFTYSTNGYILLFLNWVIYVYYSKHKSLIIIFTLGVSLIIMPLFWSNITSKFSGDNQVSGLARIRDIQVGHYLLTEHPLIGINQNIINNIPDVKRLKENLFYSKMGSAANELNTAYFVEDGFLNGFLGVFLDWGLIIGTYIVFLYCRSPLLYDNKTMLIFACIVFLSMFAEPISRTIFFYIFPFSALLIKVTTQHPSTNFKNYSPQP